MPFNKPAIKSEYEKVLLNTSCQHLNHLLINKTMKHILQSTTPKSQLFLKWANSSSPTSFQTPLLATSTLSNIKSTFHLYRIFFKRYNKNDVDKARYRLTYTSSTPLQYVPFDWYMLHVSHVGKIDPQARQQVFMAMYHRKRRKRKRKGKHQILLAFLRDRDS